MLHLIYTFRPTAAARADLPAFWRWVGERETADDRVEHVDAE